MEKETHSPGPWTASQWQDDSFTYNSEVIDRDGSRVVGIVRKADAELIAAAPELLECLRDIMACGIRKLDDRIGYDELQIDRTTQEEAIALLRRFE